MFVDVRDVDTLAVVTAEPPAMEGAFEAGALDEPPHGQVGPHVRAVGVDRVRPPILAPKHCQVLTCKKNKNAVRFKPA